MNVIKDSNLFLQKQCVWIRFIDQLFFKRNEWRHVFSMMVLFFCGGLVTVSAALPVGGFSASVRSVNSSKCMDVAGAAKTIGANAIQANCSEGLSQKIVFLPVSGKNEVFNLKPAHSGLCLGVLIGRRQQGVYIQQDKCNGFLNQQFKLLDRGNNQYELIASHTNRLLDVQLSSKDEGAKLIQSKQKNSDSQKWQLDSISTAINPVQIENAKQGVVFKGFPYAQNHELEGYTSKVSVEAGQSIDFLVNAQIDQSYTLTLYRLGWYKGYGVRQVLAPVSLQGIKQVMPVADPLTGLIEANWTNPYTVNIPSDWVSGYYVATVVGNETGLGRFIPFVVTNNGRYSDYLLQASVSTWQAYNNWGGKSLFPYNSSNAQPAMKVSFNRPYTEGSGTGEFTGWEVNMLLFLEREGYDLAYQTDVDTHLDASALMTHKALIAPGQSEFWTVNMRDNVEFALSHGQSLGVFGANAGYWQARFESSNVGQPLRTLVSYKEAALTDDPLALDNDVNNDKYITTLWRSPQVNRPENALFGIMYAYEKVIGDVIVSNASHWVFAGTNLQNGDKLPGLLGGLVDAYVDNGQTPANIEGLAHSPVNASVFSDMSVYTKSCMAVPCVNKVATVFAAGTLNWSWGVDGYNNAKNLESEAVKQITRNVLARMVN